MNILLDSARGALAFVAVLGLVVSIHEAGHYLLARWLGVHVEAFALGFGRPLLKWTDRRGTEWRIGWIPAGGYVKLHGMAPGHELPANSDTRSFQAATLLSRALIIAAGPAANFLLSAVLYVGLFAVIGRPTTPPLIGSVVEAAPAAKAGFRVGDTIVAMDGEPVRTFDEAVRHIAPRPGVPIVVLVRRTGGAEALLTVVPEAKAGAGVIGVTGSPLEYERISFPASVVAGVSMTCDMTARTLGGIWRILAASHGAESIGGPLRVAQMSGQVAEVGLAALAGFAALLSVSLGVFNLLPVPMLDGGHLGFLLAEAIHGRPLSGRVRAVGMRAGVAFLLSLFVFAMWSDVAAFFTKGPHP